MQLELMKEFRFEASHILPKHPGKCSRLHGHSWVLRVSVKGELNEETGFVMDYATLKEFVQPIVDDLDHKHLGQWDLCICPSPNYDAQKTKWGVFDLPLNFYPSSENLIVWIAEELLSQSHTKRGIKLGQFPWSKLELDETCTSRCILTREDYDAGRR